ncbi:MAG: metal-dependent hydrolase [Rubrobacter sp.]|nr:metal-dependent hydrolase [Rubrobacter sp.]
METQLHSFYTWALAKYGVKAGRAAGIAGAVGAAISDVPAFIATAYYIGPVYLRDGWSSMDTEAVLSAIYFTGPFGATGSALHSIVPVAVLLGAYRIFGFGRHDVRRIFLWFLLGWLGHTVVDFLTHVDDGRPLFWPFSDWMWSSPVSYYDSDYYGREFSLISNGAAVALMALPLVRRVVRRWRKKSGGGL